MGFRQTRGIADINKEPTQAPKQEETTAPVTEQVVALVVSEQKTEAAVGAASDVTKLLEKTEDELAKDNVAVVETKKEEDVADKKPTVKKKVTSTKKTKS